jgi:hypothetical protein
MSRQKSKYPDPDIIRTVSARAEVRTAHHEAGHAVAAVARGGWLERVHLGHVNWTAVDFSGDEPAETHHLTRSEDMPFVTFAGPWAHAMWEVDHDDTGDPATLTVEYPDRVADRWLTDDDFSAALEYAWLDADTDSAKYEDRISTVDGIATQLGLGPVGRAWEICWHDELCELWPAICEVAALLIDGHVTHDTVRAAVERAVPAEQENVR